MRSNFVCSFMLGLGLWLFPVSTSMCFNQLAAEIAHNRKASPFSSKEEFEISLASKFQLLRVRIEQLARLNAAFGRLSTAIRAEESKPVSEQRFRELADVEGLQEAAEIESSLGALGENYYVGERAKDFLQLSQKKQRQKLEDNFIQLEEEIRAEIKIAQNLGINIRSYERELTDFCQERIMCKIWVSIFAGNNN